MIDYISRYIILHFCQISMPTPARSINSVGDVPPNAHKLDLGIRFSENTPFFSPMFHRYSFVLRAKHVLSECFV